MTAPRITNFSTTLKHWEGVRINAGDIQIEVSAVPCDASNRIRLTFHAPESVRIRRLDKFGDVVETNKAKETAWDGET